MPLPARFTRKLFPAICTLLPAAALAAQAVPPQQFYRLGDVPLEKGGAIRDCKLGYRTIGTLNADRSNAVLFTTWHTGTSGEAAALLAPDKLWDPAGYYVIVVDAIGNGVSCSPSNSRRQHGAAFPTFTIRDMVATEHRLLTEKLGITHVKAVLGYSMGAMQAYQWLASYPDFMDSAVPIAGTPRLASPDLLLMHTLDRAMDSEPAYAHGRYRKNPPLPQYQLTFALHFSTQAYRAAQTPPAAFARFYQETAGPDPDAADANNSRWQIRAMQAHDIAPGAALEAVAARSKAKVHTIVMREDRFIYPGTALAFARQAAGSTTILEAACGHAALECDMASVRSAVAQALQGDAN